MIGEVWYKFSLSILWNVQFLAANRNCHNVLQPHLGNLWHFIYFYDHSLGHSMLAIKNQATLGNNGNLGGV